MNDCKFVQQEHVCLQIQLGTKLWVFVDGACERERERKTYEWRLKVPSNGFQTISDSLVSFMCGLTSHILPSILMSHPSFNDITVQSLGYCLFNAKVYNKKIDSVWNLKQL